MVDRYHGGYSDPSEAKTCKAVLAEVRRDNAELREQIDVLKTHVERLRGNLTNAANHLDRAARRGFARDPYETARDSANTLLSETPAQSLQAHDLEIAERVREACADAVNGMYDHPKYVADIRHLDLSEVIKDG